MPNKIPILSVIILNYKSGSYLSDCIKSIVKSKLTDPIELIVADNDSPDDSFIQAQSISIDNPKIINSFFVNLKSNKGFSSGNNQALKFSHPDSKYVLFLNPDTTVETDTFQKMIIFFESNPQVDASTCHITLALTGQLQPEAHRGFPTPINTFWHFFGFGLPKLFPKSKFFNSYFMGHLDYTQVQQIEATVGAFFMLKRQVGDRVGWWNEKYFMYGEDLDLSYKLFQNGFKLFFYPHARITHYQGVSSGIKAHSQNITQATRSTKVRSAKASTQAMRIFYQLNLIDRYPKVLRPLINSGINLLEFYRIFKAKYL